MSPFIPFIAFVLDLILKDPQTWPHPVRWIGSFLNRMEAWARGQSRFSLRQAGVISLVGLLAIVWLSASILTSIPLFGPLIAIALAYAGLSLGGLLESARDVLNAIKADDLESARHKLSMLVSRDTSEMDRRELSRSLAETVSENFNDGLTAPFFYLLLGGPVLLWLYKTVSTVDSMWGYQTPKWSSLGWAGARLDDVLAFIPARLSAGVLILTGLLLSRNWKQAMRQTSKQARQMKSPNAGWPMAAAAWIMEGTMGGWAAYHGQRTFKPILGPTDMEWTEDTLTSLLTLIHTSGWILALAGLIILFFL